MYLKTKKDKTILFCFNIALESARVLQFFVFFVGSIPAREETFPFHIFICFMVGIDIFQYLKVLGLVDIEIKTKSQFR